MLRAYVDDSEYQGQPPMFILAGYISTAEKWSAFSEEWQAVLDMHPRIKCFKLKEAIKGIGPFHGQTFDQCHERIALFRRVVEKHVHAEFGIAFRIDHFKEVFAAIGKPYTNPFYYAQMTLVGDLAFNLKSYGLPQEPVDFIFDNRAIEKARVIEGWDGVMKLMGTPGHDDLTDVMSIIRNPPYFQDDEEVLPLQAADMCATLVRLRLTEDLPEEKDLDGFSRRIRGSMLLPDKRSFQLFVYGLLERYAPEELEKARAALKKKE